MLQNICKHTKELEFITDDIDAEYYTKDIDIKTTLGIG
jgi:hypothetical protein